MSKIAPRTDELSKAPNDTGMPPVMRSAIPRATEPLPSVADERIDFQPRVEKSVGKAAGESGQKAAEEADGLAAGVAHQHGCDDSGQTDDRTHGKIDAAGDDDRACPKATIATTEAWRPTFSRLRGSRK